MKRLIHMRRRNERVERMPDGSNESGAADQAAPSSDTIAFRERLIERAGAQVGGRISEFTSQFAALVDAKISKKSEV